MCGGAYLLNARRVFRGAPGGFRPGFVTPYSLATVRVSSTNVNNLSFTFLFDCIIAVGLLVTASSARNLTNSGVSALTAAHDSVGIPAARSLSRCAERLRAENVHVILVETVNS